MILTVTEAQIAAINNIGRFRLPNEAVGLIVKRQVLELPNRSLSPTNQFLVKTDDIALAVEVSSLTLTEDDWNSIILWHTHPGGLVGPSRTDMHNKNPHFQNLVVTLTDTGPVATFY